MHVSVALALFLVPGFLMVAFNAYTDAQYLRNANVSVLKVYPPPGEEEDGRVSLYFALMQSFGGSYTSAGVIPGIEVALDEINANRSVLPGYRLHYYLTDTQCGLVPALDQFIKQVSEPPTKVAAIGAGCSLATEPTAEISHYWQIPQLSCTSSSPNLGNRKRFKRHFGLIQSEESLAYGYYGIIRNFKWRSVTIFLLDVDLFEVSTLRLAQLLSTDGIKYTIKSFQAREGIQQLGDNPFDGGDRIFIMEMYHTYARELLCKAYNSGVKYPGYVLIHPAWYIADWWVGDDDHYNCSSQQRESVLPHMLSVYQYEFIEDYERVAESGTTGAQFLSRYYEKFRNDTLFNGLSYNNLSQTCYDGTWALALALSQTINDIGNNSELNAKAREEAELTSSSFQIENFTYNNSAVVEVLFNYLERTEFQGITGEIKFDPSGIRIGGRLQVFQSRTNQQGVLISIKIADVMRGNNTFLYTGDESDESTWPDGIPYDGVPVNEVVTVHISVTVIIVLLATVGMVFTAVCLIFNFIFRNQKLIRLSSTNLNYFIGTGAVLLYIDAYLLVIPSPNSSVTTIICNITPWLSSLGYSLCFGTIMAKMIRVFYIFNNPSIQKKTIKDWHLVLFICTLIVVDLIILVTYNLVQGVRESITAIEQENTEHPFDTKGVFSREFEYSIYVCISTERQITLGVLYGYKALLQLLAVILALKTRNVKVKGLDDSKYIIAATYLSSLVLLTVIIMTYTAYDLINTYAVVTSVSFILGSTMIVGLVFIPKMIGLYQDPEGTTVFSAADSKYARDENVSMSAMRKKIEDLEKKLDSSQQEARTQTSQSEDTKL